MITARIDTFISEGKGRGMVKQTTKYKALKGPRRKRPMDPDKLTDLTLFAEAQAASNYQTVKIGVSVTVKDIDLGSAGDYQDLLKPLVFSELEDMKPDMYQLIEDLVQETTR